MILKNLFEVGLVIEFAILWFIRYHVTFVNSDQRNLGGIDGYGVGAQIWKIDARRKSFEC